LVGGHDFIAGEALYEPDTLFESATDYPHPVRGIEPGPVEQIILLTKFFQYPRATEDNGPQFKAESAPGLPAERGAGTQQFRGTLDLEVNQLLDAGTVTSLLNVFFAHSKLLHFIQRDVYTVFLPVIPIDILHKVD
jgi:hypothetical protein